MRKVLALVASTLLLAGCAGSSTDPIEVVEGTTVAIGDLKVGQCLSEEAATGEVGIAQAVDCEKPHFGEVMSAGNVRTKGDRFDATKIAELANNFCITSFEKFAGLRYDRSELEMFPLVPSQKSWAKGDRIATCIIYDENKLTTGGLRNANR
jgi:hypothetical protein